MWNQKQSVVLSLILAYLFSAALVGAIFTAPYIVKWYTEYTGKQGNLFTVIITAFYFCVVPAGVALYTLIKLLYNIKKDAMFDKTNISCIRILSWCCFAVSIITLIFGLYYFAFFLVAVVAMFIGLILRVIKNVFVFAAQIKDENELTI